ncbi:unnamed protein product [Mytilus coruscus]|uniref:Ubiquitin-like domain-containing protein n=1 Tax=Mytilus coruscus TaxID=42192 RepID=A0A6J8DTL9_MYTCO|nr:unnamed protein product [Mytilus coruscus]
MYFKVKHQICTLNIPSCECIRRVSQEIADGEGILSFRVRIVHQGKVLDKNKTFDDYGIQADTILEVDFLSDREITLYIDIKQKNKILTLTLQNTCTLHDIKLAVKTVEAIDDCRQILSYAGHAYSVGRTPLFQTDIKDGSILDLEICRDSETKFFSTSDYCLETVKWYVNELVSNFQSFPEKPLDIVFSFNITEIETFQLDRMKFEIKELCERLLTGFPGIRSSFLVHGTRGTHKNVLFSREDFTTDVRKLQHFVKSSMKTIDNYQIKSRWILHDVQRLSWNENSTKVLVIIGDCEPNPESLHDWQAELDILNRMGVNTFCALDDRFTGSVVEDFYPQLCKKTKGFLIKKDYILPIIQDLLTNYQTYYRELQGSHDKCTEKINEMHVCEVDENNNSEHVIPKTNTKVIDDKSPQYRYHSEDNMFSNQQKKDFDKRKRRKMKSKIWKCFCGRP